MLGRAIHTRQLWSGDSVSSMVTKGDAEVIQLSWENLDVENYLCVRVNYVLAVKIKANV